MLLIMLHHKKAVQRVSRSKHINIAFASEKKETKKKTPFH